MGFNFFAQKKEIPILKEEDNIELREIRRKAYMEEAKKIMLERGKAEAKRDLELKTPPKDANGWP